MSLIKQLVAIAGLLAIVPIAALLAEQIGDTCDIDRIRLPDTVTPRHYDIQIKPDFNSMTFAGEVKIEAEYLGVNRQKCKASFADKLMRVALMSCLLDNEMSRADRQILINAGEQLQMDKIEVYEFKKTDAKNLAASFCRDRTSQMLKIKLNSKLRPGRKYEIKLAYSGIIGTLNDKGQESQGYYQSPHLAPNKTIQYINTNTHFFPADARSAFPSFDEPDFKSTFQLNITHQKDMKAISNAAIKARFWDRDHVETQFKRTDRMSTYNFAFAVGRYEMTQCADDHRIKAWTPPGVADKAQPVLDTICRAVGVAEEYFERPFPLDKLDLVLTKAMRDPSRENWGMLVITEDFFLVDDDTSNVLRVEIIKLATHILLHQWWGDLITAKWWDDQWIFDGFTIWQSHWSTAKLFPSFDYDFNYLLRIQSPMLDAHSTSAVHAIKDYQPRTAQAEIVLFDTNTFNKAGAIYQMMSSINPAAFQAGLQQLLAENAYSTIDANDWSATIGAKLGLADMQSIMRSWLDLSGIPLVSAKLTPNGQLELRQQRFLEQQNQFVAGGSLWKIPLLINVTSLSGDNFVESSAVVLDLFDLPVGSVKLPNWFDAENPKHYIKINYGFDGFYRTEYSDNLLRRLEPLIQSKDLAPADRFNLLDDYKALFKAGLVTLDKFENFLNLFKQETHGGVLSGLAATIPTLAAAHKRANKTTSYTAQIVNSLFEPTYRQFGFQVVPNQGHADMNGRQDSLAQLVVYQNEDVIQQALSTFNSSDVHLKPFLRKPVYLAVHIHGSDEQFADLIGRLRATRSLYERSLLIQFLSAYAIDADRKARMSATLKE